MKRLNPEYVAKVSQFVNSSPYFSLISMKIRDVGIGYSILEIEVAEKHLHPMGQVHGGVFASIVDAATFWAVFSAVEDQNAGATSIDLKLNYLAPASSGKLVAKGRQIRLGKTLGYAEAEVTNESGKLLAHGTSTLMILRGRGLSASPPLPPKFLDQVEDGILEL
jgi:uncharacterized protein (TIGR00369 family)